MLVTNVAWIALPLLMGIVILALTAVVWAQNYDRKKDREQDIIDRKAVAGQVVEAARLLRINNIRAAEAEDITSRKLDDVKHQGDKTHALVNSQFTALLESNLRLLEKNLIMLRTVMDLRKKLGADPSAEEEAEVAGAESEVAELRTSIADRVAQAKTAGITSP